MPAGSGSGRAGSVAGGSGSGSGSLLLSMAAIGALYENEEQQSRELFAMAKRMIQLYLDERRKASVRKADFRRSSVSESRSHPQEQTVDAPVWLVQAMLLNVVYGHNCGDKRSGEIALTHAAALVSLAQGAELLRPVRVEPVEDLGMTDGDAMWGFGGRPGDAEDHAEWMRWKSVEERKRTLYVIFILSSLLVSAYNHTPALTNSEILLDLPSDEDFFAAETSTAFYAKGGIAAANRNRMTFHEALGALLKANEWEQQQQQQQRPSSAPRRDGQQVLSPTGPGPDAAASGMQPSTFGCLILIHALHNYIWETRQRHHNKTWTHEEMEKMHRHMEPALKAWQAAWSSNPLHSLQRPNPFGMGPLSADSMPLLDLAYIRLFLDFSRSKEKFWQRDWDGVAEELGRGRDAGPHAEHSPASNAESAATDASDSSGNSSVSVDSPCTQPSSPGFSTYPATLTRASPLASTSRPTGGREKLLRKAALYAANSFCMSDELGVGLADLTRRELPIQSAMCALDCAQVLAEWVATLQDRVGRYLGILGLADVDLTQVPAIMLLEEEDVKLLGRIQDILAGAGPRTKMETGVAGRAVVDEHAGYAANLLRVTASMMGKAAVWPVTRLMVSCLETHAEHMRARAERSVLAAAQ
ncbi:hypothetical protein P8C59_002795 [Phyllachora maydis]|uniref:Xylanolytic transcriptional activator regulatory domain-containing protein n=1 Tax=Phyllachora maydis TaxID=1825666 RepID=A0AAD9M9L8_9PEZI|nr:hypothetical protein P8C59_002795 [Phyllachora maydis]